MARTDVVDPGSPVPREVARPQRYRTREVRIGPLTVGGDHPVLIQSMTIADTCDTDAVVAEILRLVEVGCPLVRVTAPSIKDAENLREIRRRLDASGVRVPLVADIHFTPNAALVAATIVDKVRINPGNYADRKRFQVFEISDREYQAELERIRDRFLPLVGALKEHGTALRIGTNHGSLSDRIMNRYGDTPEGMVESALEFVRICRDENYHEIVLSMKSSIPTVMIAAYRLLAHRMQEEGMDYPLHVGVTEAGNGLEGRIKSAVGIGSLLAAGLGDTIRVSLTEDSEHEIPACETILEAIRSEIVVGVTASPKRGPAPENENSAIFADESRGGGPSYWAGLPRSSAGIRRTSATWTISKLELGGVHPVRVELRLSLSAAAGLDPLARTRLLRLGRARGPEIVSARWTDPLTATTLTALASRVRELRMACGDHPLFLECGHPEMDTLVLTTVLQWTDGLSVAIPVTSEGVDGARVREISRACQQAGRKLRWRIPLGTRPSLASEVSDLVRETGGEAVGFVCDPGPLLIARVRSLALALADRDDLIFLETRSGGAAAPIAAGPLLCDGIGDALCLSEELGPSPSWPAGGIDWNEEPIASSYRILQACRVRLTRAEFIACPSCGRTQFDLQSTTARIHERTHHLRGVKIAIMGCIVNGPGEMADADFGYVGSGPGKVDLYVGRERIERAVPEAEAPDRLIQLLQTHGAWSEPGDPDSEDD